MPTLLKMRWSNMFSYGPNNEIDFTKSTVSQILGKNGHGKSTIAHILEELLYNKNSKGYKKAGVLNRYANGKSYSGAVEFEKDGDVYCVSVNRSGATQKVSLIKNGKDISQHTATATYELIEKIFSREFKMFSQLVYQNSRSSLQFLTATDTVRKKFLIDLLNLEKYLLKHEEIKEAAKDVVADLNKWMGELSGLESWVKTNNAKNYEYMELKEPIKIPNDLVDEYKEQSQLLNDVDLKNKKIEQNNQYIELRNSIDAASLTASIGHRNDSDLRNRVAALKQIIKSETVARDRIIKLDNTCPTCEQSIDTHFRDKLVQAADIVLYESTSKLNDLLEQIKVGEEHNKIYDKIQNDITNFEKYSNLIDSSLPTELYDKKEITTRVQELKTTIDSIIMQQNKIIVWNKEAEANNSKLELIKEQLEEARIKIIDLKEKIAELNKIINHFDILKKAFSTNGLIAYKLEYSVKELESLTNEYLMELSDGRFQLTYAAVSDKLNIIIKDNESDVEIEALSSGELARVTTATLLAIRKLLASLSKDSINVLFLDEVIDVLDDEGKERLVEVLLKETDLNTYIVSHGFTHPLLTKLRVEKVKNISRITND